MDCEQVVIRSGSQGRRGLEKGLTKSLELLTLPAPPIPLASSILSSKRIVTASGVEIGKHGATMGGGGGGGSGSVPSFRSPLLARATGFLESRS